MIESREWRLNISGLSFESLLGLEATRLEYSLSEEEVFIALSDVGKDKAPSPDGYTMTFWLFSLEIVKEEVMGFFRDFHERGRFVKSLNAVFLVLNPKKGGVEDLRD